MATYNIRKARESDCEDICSLIKEIAEYEHLSHQVKITAEELRRDGFGEEKFYHCYVAEVPSTENPDSAVVVGYALYFFTYSTFEGRSVYIEDLYITQGQRGKGIGTALWKQVAKVAIEKDCRRMDFIVLDWNEKAMALYRSRGAKDMTVTDKWHLWRMDSQALLNFVQS